MSNVEATNLMPGAVVMRSERTLPTIAWASTMIGLWPVGLTIACLEGGKCSQATASYYRYLKRTCLIGLPAIVLSTLLMVILIGIPMTFAVSIWYLARCVKAFVALYKGEPISNVDTWLV